MCASPPVTLFLLLHPVKLGCSVGSPGFAVVKSDSEETKEFLKVNRHQVCDIENNTPWNFVDKGIRICKTFCLNAYPSVVPPHVTPPHHTHTHTGKTMPFNEWHICLTTEIFNCRKHSKHKVSVNQKAQEVGGSGYLKFPVKFWLKILIPFTLTR